MNCLCCNKPLRNENKSGWHNSCIKRFFGTNTLPNLDITPETLKKLSTESTNKGYTVPGVQKKISLRLSLEDDARLTLVGYPSGYILKPQTEEYSCLPELEHLIMRMALESGIRTVPFALIKLSQDDNSLAYITKRIDRRNDKYLAMEDFCQLDGRLTEDKYKGSYERCAKIISEYSIAAGLDISELFLRLVFSFAIGNSDMHLKNFSLIETKEGLEEYVLSDAYDMLSTNIVIPEDNEEFALTMNGKKRNLKYKDFITFATVIGLPEKSAEKMIRKILTMKEKYFEMIDDSFIPEDMENDLKKLIEKRMEILAKDITL